MSRILLLLSVLSLAGCTTFGGQKHASGWAVLDKATKASCSPWPLRDKDLQVSSITVMRGSPKRLLVAGLRRDTSPLYYSAVFKNEAEVDPDKFTAMDLGRSALPLGGVTLNGKGVTLVTRNVKGQAVLEVRTLADNIVRYKGPLAASPVEEGTVVPVPGGAGAWLVIRGSDDLYRVAYVDLKKLEKPAVQMVSGVALGEKPYLLVSAAKKGALVVWKEGDTGTPFQLRWVNEAGTAGAATKLDVAVTSQSESWAVTAHAGGYYLAFIDGDSLIGQSELKISHFNWGDSDTATTRWTQASNLKDEHVSEPFFVPTEKGLELMLLKWVDDESTIARYIVASGTFGKPSFSGIFPKGSKVIEAFTGDSPGDVFVVTRQRQDDRWGFQMCEL